MIAEAAEAGYLAISVTFLTGRYHGKEWPPAPARAFQALVAGSRIAARSPEEREEDTEALRWLEQQLPPIMVVPRAASRGFSYKIFVPSNDGDAVALGRKDPEDIRVEKLVNPWILSEGPLWDTPDVVRYVWTVHEDEREKVMRLRPGLSRLARGLLCLGWGIDQATGYAELLDEDGLRRLGGVRWQPSDGHLGRLLSVPTKGYLADLEASFEASQGRVGEGGIVNAGARGTSYGESRYRRADEIDLGGAVFFELRDESGAFAPVRWEDGMLVSAWLRHAVAERLRKEGMEDAWVDANVLGHPAAGAERGRHASFVPLPSLGHQHADGAHRRALVLLDPTHGLAIAETLSWALDGAWLTDAGGQRRARLEHVQDLEGVFELYTGRARTWLTATPLVMHGRDHLRGKLAPRKIAKLVVQALEGSGIPGEVLDDLWFQPAPLWPGAGGARNYRVPAHLASWPRYHVGIRFRLPVSGPLVLGIGRHYGLGLFARADPES